MQSRWFNAAVVVLWLVTMSWLVTEKVLPPMLVGEPPSYGKIVEAQRNAPPVGWRMLLNGRQLGWALSDTKLQPTGLTDIHGRVHFDSLPLHELLPEWLRALTQLMARPLDQLQLDARSMLTIDSLGHLVRFDSMVRVDPFKELIYMHGTVEGRQLDLVVRNSKGTFANEITIPVDGLLCDALSPQSTLPGLRVGQKWTMPIYSPLWSAKSPLEIVEARVDSSEPFLWNDVVEDCWVVLYQSDPGSQPNGKENLRGKLWVRRNGEVLRQQLFLLNSVVVFDRLSSSKAKRLAKTAGEEWWSMEEELRGETHD
jgi:hypothetical protein